MIEQKAKEILADLLDTSPGDIGSNTSSDAVPAWDSLKHILIVTALEEEFDVQMSVEEMQEMTSYDRIVHVLAAKIGGDPTEW